MVVAPWYYPQATQSHALRELRHLRVYCNICNPERKAEWPGYTSPLHSRNWGQPPPPPAHLETVQPIAYVGKALLGCDIIHEHHTISLSEQLPCHAMVPARGVCVRPGLLG